LDINGFPDISLIDFDRLCYNSTSTTNVSLFFSYDFIFCCNKAKGGTKDGLTDYLVLNDS
jgi:hypothetical protein